MERSHQVSRPSLFFPIILITAGVVWLLINNGVVAVENLYRLIPYWPVLLILAGVSLILQRIWWPLSGLLWLLAAAFFVWALVFPPAFLPAQPALDLKQGTYSEPLDQASAASVRLDLSVQPATIQVLENSSDLISADMSYVGEIIFETSGTTEKSVRLDQTSGSGFWIVRWDMFIGQDLGTWEIGLTPEIPLALTVDVGTGRADIDLSGLILESLDIDGGTGGMNIILPAESEHYNFKLDVSTGGTSVQIPKGASVDLDLDGGTGSVVIDVADNAGVQVEVRDGGVGALRLPPGFVKVDGEAGDDEGVWENDAYTSTSAPVRIILDIGTGSVEIR